MSNLFEEVKKQVGLNPSENLISFVTSYSVC